MAYATEVDAVMEAEKKKTARRRSDVRTAGSTEENMLEEIKMLKGVLKV